MKSLERVFTVFLSPFEGTPEEWRDRSASALKELLDADYAMYSEYTIGNMSFRVSDPPAKGTEKMEAIGDEMAQPEPSHPLVHRLMTLERSGHLPVFTTPLLDSLLDGRFKESPFYTDVMEPAGMNHIAGLASIGATATRRLAVGWDRKRDFTLDDRTLETLRLVHPAFDAACRLIDQAEMSRRALLTTIDESANGMALVAPEGKEIHRNPFLRRLISADGETGLMRQAIIRAAAEFDSTHARARGSVSGGKFTVSSRQGEYSVRASVLAPTFGIPDKTVLVTVSEIAAQLPLAGEIERRFGLTRRQADVARLLAARLSDAEIASRLGVSWHTVRSHVNGVLSAIGAHSRQEIIDRIRSE
jgi:DNA-binding CsgD family transcriptional regulator